MMVEIFAGTLPHSGYAGIDKNKGWGNMFLAFSPKLLSDIDEFKNRMEKMVIKIRNSKTKDGGKVRIAGEKTLDTRNKNLKSGEIEIADKMYELLLEALKR
jgi:LDH2 family malate/lactate/ureidoglycolate dehydrogenase